jgi:DNA-binding SARP family transcriptional activator
MTQPVSEMEEDVRFEILGPVRVSVRGQEIAITAGRDRAVLAMVILHANRVVPMSDLIDTVWADAPPRDGRGQLHGCVSRLRKQLERYGAAARIVTVSEGYLLRADGASIDLLEFHSLAADARAAAADGDSYEARERYRAALRLWRGSLWPTSTGERSGRLRRALTRNAPGCWRSASSWS